MVCLGESKASVLEVMVKGGEQVRSKRPPGSSPNGEFGFISFLASVRGWHPQGHLILASSQGLHLGRTPRQRDAGSWQMPDNLSNFRAGPKSSASSECPWLWVFPGGMEDGLGK